MRIAYFLGTSLVDCPGRLSAVLWTVGCNLRCPFCYNAELVLPDLLETPLLAPAEVMGKLRERRGFASALAVTGGEPTLQGDLPEFLGEVRALGLYIKLDTNGTRPEVLERLLGEGLVDYVAMDIKAPFPRYREFVGLPPEAPDVVPKIKESISILTREAREYELRTTVAPGLSEDDLAEIACYLGNVGVKRYVLQPFFLPEGKRLVDESWRDRSRDRPRLSTEGLKGIASRLNSLVPTEVRG